MQNVGYHYFLITEQVLYVHAVTGSQCRAVAHKKLTHPAVISVKLRIRCNGLLTEGSGTLFCIIMAHFDL